jgi:hypothetical protein
LEQRKEGAKPPLRTKHVWSIRTKLALMGAVLNLGGDNLYPLAYLLVSATTLLLAAIVFAALSTPAAKERQ